MKKYLKFLPIVLIAIAIPVSIFLILQTQENRSRAQMPPIGDTSTDGGGRTAPSSSPAVANPRCPNNTTTIGGIDVGSPICVSVDPADSSQSMQRIISFAIILILSLSALISLFMLLWGAIKYIVSQGSKDGVASAKKTIMYAIIGLVVTASSFAIISVVGQIFGFTLFTETGSSRARERGVEQAVRDEQALISQQCAAAISQDAFNQCATNYCNSKYQYEADIRDDCIQLSRGLYDDELARQLKQIATTCRTSTQNSERDINECYVTNCNITYTNTENRQDCINFFTKP